MLRLAKLTDYAIVIATYFAEFERSETALTTRTLADMSGLPLPTVSKILKALSKAGLLSSLRGSSGGYRLARAASSVTVADVIAAIEGPIALTECSDGELAGACEIEVRCPSRANWRRINQTVADALGTLRISDMPRPRVRPQGELVHIGGLQVIEPGRRPLAHEEV